MVFGLCSRCAPPGLTVGLGDPEGLFQPVLWCFLLSWELLLITTILVLPGKQGLQDTSCPVCPCFLEAFFVLFFNFLELQVN